MEPERKRPGIRVVHSVDDFVFSVPDLAEAGRFYAGSGLDVRRSTGRLALHTFGHPHAGAMCCRRRLPSACNP